MLIERLSRNSRRRKTMKKALSIALVAALSLIFFLAVVHAQEEGGGEAVPEQLEQELAVMETVFGDLESFMGELIGEVKGNMAGIARLDEDSKNLRNILDAVTIELKAAEGRMVNLREDVDKMSNVQQEFKVRIIALEAGLSELSAFCDELSVKADVTAEDVAKLKESCDALAADYSAFKVAILADISALKKGHEALVARVQKIEDEDVGTFKKKVLELERTISALSIRIDNNRAKLEGFDHAIASLANDVEANKSGILANMSLLEDHEARLLALEDGTMVADLQEQVNTLYFLAIIALLAGVGALIWGFMGP
jgi:chromosome segregation ATPase